MSNPKFKVIFTESDRNTADNAKQYYEGKSKKIRRNIKRSRLHLSHFCAFFYHTYDINNNLF